MPKKHTAIRIDENILAEIKECRRIVTEEAPGMELNVTQVIEQALRVWLDDFKKTWGVE